MRVTDLKPLEQNLPLPHQWVQNAVVLIPWIPQVRVTAILIVMILGLLAALLALADYWKGCKSINSGRSDRACAAH